MFPPPVAGRKVKAFLVERYVPATLAPTLLASVARLAEICSATGGSVEVRYLQSAYLPTEDTCFCLFLGPSSDAIRQANSMAGFDLDRMTDALLLLPDRPGRPHGRPEHDNPSPEKGKS